MKQSNMDWLNKELPQLVDKKVITGEAAANIKTYYANQVPVNPARVSAIISLIGAILIGLGVILVLAYNWENNISKSFRLLISLGLLVISQVGMFWGISRSQLKPGYREALAAFQSLMVGSSMALVGQIYHLSTHIDQFLLSWMLLILPLSYLTKTVSPAVLYSILSISWLALVQGDPLEFAIWLLLILLFFIYSYLSRAGKPTALLAWLLVLNALTAFILNFEDYFSDLFIPCIAMFFYFLFILGENIEQNMTFAKRPLSSIGIAGTIILSFQLTFTGTWDAVHTNITLTAWSIFALLTALALGLNYYAYTKHTLNRLVQISTFFPFLLLIGALLTTAAAAPLASGILMSLYLLFVSVGLLLQGIHEQKIALLNGGIISLSALILTKFFDIHQSFWGRGIAFILIGCIFIAFNFWHARRKGDSQHE